MIDTVVTSVQNTIERNPKYRFWFWHIGFWLFMCVVGFFTLILWYSEVTVDYVTHILLQAIIGLACSLVMHKMFMQMDSLALSTRVAAGLVLVLFTAFCWTVMHMQIFVFLTGFEAVWDEFGGWYFSSIFVFLCWTGLFHGVRYYELSQAEHKIMLEAETKSRLEHLKRISAQSEAMDAKLKMLRYQLNPHFLCNSLNAINSLIELGESDRAQNVTVQLSAFLRYSLDNDPDTKIPLNKEIEALNLYLNIEKTRFGDRLGVRIMIASAAQRALIPSLLLQPIIENSMKHAIAKSVDGGVIEIRADIEGNWLVMKLSDSGSDDKRAKTAAIPSEKGVGLRNIRQRLEVLYENNYHLVSARSKDGGLVTTIKIPCEYNIAIG
jgi:sensor histidine kinase YesM